MPPATLRLICCALLPLLLLVAPALVSGQPIEIALPSVCRVWNATAAHDPALLLFPDPYGLRGFQCGAIGVLHFGLSLETTPLSNEQKSTGGDFFVAVLQQTRNLLALAGAAQHRVEIFYHAVLGVAFYHVRVGPPLAAVSAVATADLWDTINTKLNANPRSVFAAVSQVTAVDLPRSISLRIVCADGTIKMSTDQCVAADTPQQNSPVNTGASIGLGVAGGMAMLLCCGYCCIRLARTGKAAQLAAELELAEAEAQEGEEVELETGMESDAEPGSASWYPGSPNRLADDMPAAVKPVTYGDDGDDTSREETIVGMDDIEASVAQKSRVSKASSRR